MHMRFSSEWETDDIQYYGKPKGLRQPSPITRSLHGMRNYYIPCNDLDMPLMILNWAGFLTNTTELSEAGWQVKCLYNSFTKKYKIQFYHPVQLMTFSLKLDSLDNINGRVFTIDLINVGGKRNKRPSLKKVVNEFMAEDIPTLIETIVELQKSARKEQIKKMELPSADVITLKLLNVK